jgi:hypothetical protein
MKRLPQEELHARIELGESALKKVRISENTSISRIP